MSSSKGTFDDPRTIPRSNTADQKKPSSEDKKLPEAEDDWYLKRKPAMNYIGLKKDSDDDFDPKQ